MTYIVIGCKIVHKIEYAASKWLRKLKKEMHNGWVIKNEAMKKEIFNKFRKEIL